MEASKRPESSSSSSSRSNGHPFKRYTAANYGLYENGSHKNQYSRKGDWVRLVLKSRELNSKASKSTSTGKLNKSSSRAWLYGIALFVAVCYLVVKAFVQGSIGLLLKGTAVVAVEALTTHRFHNVSDKNFFSEEALEYKVKFVPRMLMERIKKQRFALDDLRKLDRSSFRQPRLALVCANFEAGSDFVYLITLWKALQALGYELEVFSLQDGPMHQAWEKAGAFLTKIEFDSLQIGLGVDWLKFEAVLLSSLDMKPVLASFMQYPFQEVPVIWILHEESQRKESNLTGLPGQNDAFLSYKKAFERADVVLLSDYVLAMKYSHFDMGHFYVLPGSPIYMWEGKEFMTMHTREEVRKAMDLSLHDIAVAVIGSSFSYKSVWREHAIVMDAILPFSKTSQEGGFFLKLFFLSIGSPSNYKSALQILAAQIGLANSAVSLLWSRNDPNQLLWAADVVVYSSLREEQGFPTTLVQAMVLERPIIVPNISVIRNHVQDGVHCFMFRAGDINGLAQAFERVLSRSGVTNHARATALQSKAVVPGLFAANVTSGFAKVLEGVVQFPSEAHLPLPVSSLPEHLTKDWQWQLLEVSDSFPRQNFSKDKASLTSLHDPGKPLIKFGFESRASAAKNGRNDVLSLADWKELKRMELAEETELSEQEQLNERNEQLHGTWEEVYRIVRKAENMKNDLHEREDGELERTGQPICIYVPYFGTGTWSLIGQKSMMYRGISLIARQRRLGSDDIEASARLPLLNHSYYQDVLCDFGAFFAIANRIDRIHKNAWIGFQSWQAAGRKVSLTGKAEKALNDAVARGTNREIFFWASTDGNSRDHNYKPIYCDFWSYCDAINNGNCRQVFLRTFKEMFGLPSSWNMLPPMPRDGDGWSILHSWAMPTQSFMEFIMFSRMFVSALDSLLYVEHHNKGKCTLGSSMFEVRHCYCRLLELLINIWAYHSGRRMVFLDPETGSMHEQHNLSSRHGQMWVNFFSYDTLKAMDADLAEEADDGMTKKRWLWPRTGEVFCQQIQDRERKQRYAMKLEKKKRDKERVKRIRSRQRQRPLARG